MKNIYSKFFVRRYAPNEIFTNGSVMHSTLKVGVEKNIA